MKAKVRSIINIANARKSKGPVTVAGKQRSSMNAITHGLTGNRLILQAHELEAYNRLSEALNNDLKPKSEPERQLVQKIIDCHARLNRIAALDGNILNFGLTQNETNATHDDALESIAAQCRSWLENADSFEKLSRHEARISRQVLQFTHELERLQKEREIREYRERHGGIDLSEMVSALFGKDDGDDSDDDETDDEDDCSEGNENKTDSTKFGSFCDGPRAA